MFKRTTQRYGSTPEPVTPYQKTAQVWDERIGSARVQARNWRLMAFGCLSLALGLAGGLVWQSGKSRVTPYVVEVDKLGAVQALGPATEPYRPTDAQIAYHLARFIADVRALSIDPVVLRQNWLEAYGYATDRAAYGTTEPVAELIPYMLEGLLDADKGFAKARKDVGEVPSTPPPSKRPGQPRRTASVPPPAVPEPASGGDHTLPTT